ncbi:MAG TPA: undecaprenyl-diphosphate phosphatase, partial [Candidatus Paceibacterota bacterium]|nr:undecaprenyl-diphosphate phosphatase [Candidatus Paceibacterota bacterium]
MTYLDSIILGIVEGLTEFLPVSSTGHLILTSSLLGLPDTEFLKSFEIAIQLGAIAAVVLIYWRSFLDVAVLKRLLVAFIPTAVVGYILYKFAKSYLLGNEGVVVAALFIGGIVMLLIEYAVRNREQNEGAVTDITYKQSFLIGLAQAVAIIPGVSRSGASVIGGLM